jgi:pimeloyl-ACP methyl ester carboxylesterase
MPTLQARTGRVAYSDTSTGRVAYSDTGTGRPIVLLHATLHDRHDFDPIVDAIARHHRVIAIDWPGHGESDDAEGITGPLLADVLEDIVDVLKLKSVVLIGNSVGGSAAARLAITQPQTVAGLVLVNTGGFVPNNAFTNAFCRLMGTPAITRRVFSRFVPTYMKAQTAADERVVSKAVANARTDNGVATAASLWRSFATPEYDLRNRAGAITVPTLIVWGAKDPTLSLRIGRATHDAINRSELAVLQTGHVVFSSDPDGFLAVVEPFLRRIEVDASARAR